MFSSSRYVKSHYSGVPGKVKGKLLLTINNHPDIRKLYKGLPQLTINVTYSVARDKSAKSRKRTELIIANYPLPGKGADNK